MLSVANTRFNPSPHRAGGIPQQNLKICKDSDGNEGGKCRGESSKSAHGDEVAVAPGDVVASGEEIAHGLEEAFHLGLHRSVVVCGGAIGIRGGGRAGGGLFQASCAGMGVEPQKEEWGFEKC
jgi:hypothetical protein